MLIGARRRVALATLLIGGLGCSGDDGDLSGSTVDGTVTGDDTGDGEVTETGGDTSTGASSSSGEGTSSGAVDTTGDSSEAGTDSDTSSGVETGAMVDGTRVFVTSTKFDGNLGGLVGGDARCETLADAAGLGGSWLAWLGDGTDGPATRFAQSDEAYRLVGGGVVADNWDDLIDGTIGVPIDRDETGTALPAADDMIVWTAVFHTGGNPTPVNCEGWTSAAETFVPTGLASATDTGWTVFAPHNCSELHRLYCFEQ